jgi:hypothetical protein
MFQLLSHATERPQEVIAVGGRYTGDPRKFDPGNGLDPIPFVSISFAIEKFTVKVIFFFFSSS